MNLSDLQSVINQVVVNDLCGAGTWEKTMGRIGHVQEGEGLIRWERKYDYSRKGKEGRETAKHRRDKYTGRMSLLEQSGTRRKLNCMDNCSYYYTVYMCTWEYYNVTCLMY